MNSYYVSIHWWTWNIQIIYSLINLLDDIINDDLFGPKLKI